MADGLVLENLSVARDGQIMFDIDHRVAPGDILTVMGPSGAGKSTLLSVITGTLSPVFRTAGRVLLDGMDLSPLPPEQRRVGILFQDDLLFPHLSVGENLAFGLSASVQGRATRQARIEDALDEIGLAGFSQRDPATLSGGQKARVALMRMLLSEPRALLLDEPFSRLDAELRAQVRSLVFARAQARGLPVVLVTHDAEDAAAAGGDVYKIG
jgi:putative thiamine transport system ATP-binding protein